MPVQDIECPPKIAATSHSPRPKLIFREVGMQPVKLRNSNSLADLRSVSIWGKKGKKRDGWDRSNSTYTCADSR